ncbi:hypothetical protein [Neobacillus drentensis]|uniref:WapI family immunity protein n=1 Tax=Neobacillus drentensis TaxID=220684 RepID=UPI000824478B|nr:hypothetical protein [Neobacillus drentensis]
MKIKGEDKHSYIKIHVDKDDDMGVRFSVETQSRGISADFGGIYIVTSDITEFLSALRKLENKRSGEACLKSASPEEFNLSVRTVNRRGHILVSLRMKDLSYYEDLMIPCSIEVCFGIDPTTLPELLKQCEQLEWDTV